MGALLYINSHTVSKIPMEISTIIRNPPAYVGYKLINTVSKIPMEFSTIIRNPPTSWVPPYD